MIRPLHFGSNPETLANNSFQQEETSLTDVEIQEKALSEFNAFVDQLQSNGIEVIIFEDTDKPFTPDAVFPNNWISFHENGTIATYPMFSKIRRGEVRSDIVRTMMTRFGYTENLNLSPQSDSDFFLEGTGSMVLDRENRIAYACRSARTHISLFQQFCIQLDFEGVLFNAVDSNNVPIYHTNVMMAIGTSFVVICLESIKDDKEKQQLLEGFVKTKKEVIDISMEQLKSFAGNMLQVEGKEGKSYLIMSETARKSLTSDQVNTIENHATILSAAIPTIEKFSGGSVRCMLAEIFEVGNRWQPTANSF